ncbi:MAG TPA: trypsin-like serine protease [Polyangiaceae bacterium]|jgi:MYXO-CTERM domain-containing protein
MERTARRLAAVIVSLSFSAGCGADAPPDAPGAPVVSSESLHQAMSGGAVDNGDLAVGLLFSHETLSDGGLFVKESCSGELIAPDLVLTAGHCFDTNVMDSFYVGQGVAIQGTDTNWDPATIHMTKYTIDTFVRPPAYKPNSGTPPTVLDVAVAHLTTPVTGVTPLALASAPPPVGASVTTIGFGRHPTSAAPDPTCLQNCNADCTCMKNTCGCNDLQTLFGTSCLCNDQGSFDQFVKRTATVKVAEVLATTLHQTDVSQSTDLPGDSGGAVLYNGAIVGTDCCGNGPANAQTDQYFARIDLARDWIVSQLGDGGVAEGGAPPASDGGNDGGTPTDGGDDGSPAADAGGVTLPGTDAGGSTGTGGGSSGGTSSGGGTPGPSADGGNGSTSNGGSAGSGSSGSGSSSGCGCALAGDESRDAPHAWLALAGLAIVVGRRARRR